MTGPSMLAPNALMANPLLHFAMGTLAGSQGGWQRPNPWQGAMGGLQSAQQAQLGLQQIAEQRRRQKQFEDQQRAVNLVAAGGHSREGAQAILGQAFPQMAAAQMFAPSKAVRPLTDAEKTQYGIDPTKFAQMGPHGRVSMPGGAAVNIQMPTEKARDIRAFVENMAFASQLESELEYDPVEPTLSESKWTNWLASPAGQQAYTTQMAWTSNLLRAESGADVPEAELRRQHRIYWPVVGDKPGTIEAKRKLRAKKQGTMYTRAGIEPPAGELPIGSVLRPEQVPFEVAPGATVKRVR